MKSCLLVGSVGHPNFGDEAIMRVWIDNYQQVLHDRIIFCDGPGRNLKKCIDQSRVQNVHVASELQSIYSTVGYFDYTGSKVAIRDIDHYKKTIKLIAKNLREFETESIHLFGGGYLNSLWKHNYGLIISSLLVGLEAKIPVFASGLGVLPCDPKNHNLLKLLEYFIDLDVRDKESFNLLSSLCNSSAISFSGDDVLLAFCADKNILVNEEDDPSIVICLQNDLFEGYGFLDKILSDDCLSVYINKNIKNIKIISAMEDDVKIQDQATLDRIQSFGMTVTNIDHYALIEQGLPVNKHSFYITSRYHFHLIASLWGCKGIAVSNHHYYDVKHNSVNIMGSLWKVCNLDEATNIFLDSEKISYLIELSSSYNETVRKFYMSKKIAFRDSLLQKIGGTIDDSFNMDFVVDLIKTIDAPSVL
ncbi:polysaccharide pyruvyl transferase family protein [Commensalibacter oyaizuii]|uniref:Polysaccharide pyruvyl transferase family protein n=1 Tax=Commensalibacter oyaizuii TaxID=3043873 RepID=A0ABT6Q1T2_9PROT|nr:polysaccharide pyruvyl transferase family protein [Commensalibacter sp. TBRC 16381]MDI2090701.1 polysaccharide pyruvyl transferase family protein [Commensalibacter sp. TBRC 16381]